MQVLVRGVVEWQEITEYESTRTQTLDVVLGNGWPIRVEHDFTGSNSIPRSVVGRMIYVYGLFEFSSVGGIVYKTEKDPEGFHEDGWIQFDGKRYE